MKIPNRILALLFSFLMAVTSFFTGQKRLEPVFPDSTEPRIKAEFDEGEFDMKSFDIVVSPLGDDGNPGTAEAPLKTPQAAKEKAKGLKNADCGRVTVWFRQGVYTLSDTLEFTAEDLSGVTYRSYPGESVRFSGAREISDFEETEINGVRAFTAAVPINGEKGYFNTLYNGTKRLSRTRYPDSGELTVRDVSDADAFRPEVDLFKLHAAFYADTANVMDFKNLNDVDVRILHYWNDELLPISSLDTQTGRIETQKPASITIFKEDRFFFENVFEALNTPGEWYLDRSEGKLYYLPLDGETVENTVLKAGITERLVTLDGCADIDFQGIEFCDSTWNITSGEHFTNYMESENALKNNIKFAPNFPQACFDQPCAVTLTGCENVNFTDCTFNRIGSSALMFGLGSKNCMVRASRFEDIGGNAVYIKGANEAASPQCTTGITVTDCHICTYGRIFNNAIGVLLVHASDCEISQNEIHDGFYTAISSGWIWGYDFNITDNIRITNNLIYNIGQGWLADMGGIYTLGIQPHSVVSGNVIHNVGAYNGGSGYGGWGIYLDEGSSGILVEKNLAYNCSSQGFHQHYGRDNTVRNNIFALNGDGQFRVSKKEEHNSLYLYNNILLGDNSPMYFHSERGQFVDGGNLYWDLTRKGFVLSGYSISAKDRLTARDMEKLGYYKDGVFADPLFKDAGHGDFTLALNSPALDSGFEPWDYSAAGTLTAF